MCSLCITPTLRATYGGVQPRVLRWRSWRPVSCVCGKGSWPSTATRRPAASGPRTSPPPVAAACKTSRNRCCCCRESPCRALGPSIRPPVCTLNRTPRGRLRGVCACVAWISACGHACMWCRMFLMVHSGMFPSRPGMTMSRARMSDLESLCRDARDAHAAHGWGCAQSAVRQCGGDRGFAPEPPCALAGAHVPRVRALERETRASFVLGNLRDRSV